MDPVGNNAGDFRPFVKLALRAQMRRDGADRDTIRAALNDDDVLDAITSHFRQVKAEAGDARSWLEFLIANGPQIVALIKLILSIAA